MSTLTINNAIFINQGSSSWTIRNNDCGTNSNNVPATINSVSINGVQIGNLIGSTFPLTSTLQQRHSLKQRRLVGVLWKLRSGLMKWL